MPRYDYKCMACKRYDELMHDFNDVTLKVCDCGSTMKKVFTPTPAVFKGNGFYKTDNRK